MSEQTSEFEKRYNANKEDLFFYILKSVKDHSLAADILQDTFLNFIRHYKSSKIPNPQESRMILFRAARNLLINYYHSFYYRKIHIVPEAETMQGFQNNSTEKQVMKKLQQEEMEKVFEQLLAMLDTEYREILELRYRSNLSLFEIAEIIGLSISTASRRIEKAERILIDIAKHNNFNPSDYLSE